VQRYIKDPDIAAVLSGFPGGQALLKSMGNSDAAQEMLLNYVDDSNYMCHSGCMGINGCDSCNQRELADNYVLDYSHHLGDPSPYQFGGHTWPALSGAPAQDGASQGYIKGPGLTCNGPNDKNGYCYFSGVNTNCAINHTRLNQFLTFIHYHTF